MNLLEIHPSRRACSPPPCLTFNGTSVCGYDCKGEAGKVVCFDPAAEVYAVWGAGAPAPSCEAREGKVACGYGCLYSSGELRCAQTPGGKCTAQSGGPQCFDPPIEATGQRCLAVLGDTLAR